MADELKRLRHNVSHVLNGPVALVLLNSSANISRHLALLTQHGLVARENRGTSATDSIADPSVYALCDLVCGSIVRQIKRSAQGQAAFVTPATKRVRGR